MTEGMTKQVTQEEFDAALVALLEEMSAEEIIAIPGVYEAVSEALNNDAIARAIEIRGES